MSTAVLAWIRRRWDAASDPERPVPFATLRTQINLKRLELLGWVGLANEAFEGFWAATTGRQDYLHLVGVVALVDLAIIGATVWTRRHGGPRLGAWLPPLAVTLILLMLQASIAVVAASGRLSSSFPLGLVTIALLFVLPPRMLAAIMIGTFASFALIVWHADAPFMERIVGIRIAGLMAVVATVAGSLIHAARERDHLQKQAIHDQNRRLLRHNEEMEEVMTFAAHDLRSPLLGLRNLVAFAQPRAAAEPELAGHMLAEAGRSLDAALGLIDRLLAAHEAEYGPVRLVEGDLRLALTAAAERNRVLAQAAGVILTLDLPERPLPGRHDPAALARILDNLVANAIRFSPTGGTVTLCGERGTGRSLLSVRDEGPGIPEADRAHLFEKFRRGRTAPMRGAAGTGMGLYIAALLTERLGGRLSYRPHTLRGSVFDLALGDAAVLAPSSSTGPAAVRVDLPERAV